MVHGQCAGVFETHGEWRWCPNCKRRVFAADGFAVTCPECKTEVQPLTRTVTRNEGGN